LTASSITTHRRGGHQRQDRVGVDPVGKHRASLGGHPLAGQPLVHGRRDRRHAVESPQQPSFQPRQCAPRERSVQEPERERRVDFEILHVLAAVSTLVFTLYVDDVSAGAEGATKRAVGLTIREG
jgi:hypothetical protein